MERCASAHRHAEAPLAQCDTMEEALARRDLVDSCSSFFLFRQYPKPSGTPQNIITLASCLSLSQASSTGRMHFPKLQFGWQEQFVDPCSCSASSTQQVIRIDGEDPVLFADYEAIRSTPRYSHRLVRQLQLLLRVHCVRSGRVSLLRQRAKRRPRSEVATWRSPSAVRVLGVCLVATE